MIVAIDGPLGQFLTADLQREALSYYKLPQQMLDRFAAYVPAMGDAAPLSAEEFKRVRAAVARYAEESVAAYNNPYHGMPHFTKHAKNGVMLHNACIGDEDNDASLAMRQLMELGGLLHDCHHPGCTLRIDSPTERWHKPELGAEVTCEYVSALSAAELFEREGLSLVWQLGVVCLILMSTFGHADAAKRGFGFVPQIAKPRNPSLTAFVLADVWPSGDATDGLMDGVHINMLETNASGRRTNDPMEIIVGQRGFEIGYRQPLIAHFLTQVTRGHDVLERALRHSRELQHHYELAASGNWPELVAFVAHYIQEKSS